MTRSLVFFTVLSTIAGCSGSTTPDDAATTPDAFVTTDAPLPPSDGGRDAFVATDTGSDALSASDTGADAFVSSDTGTDAFVSSDAGHDASSSTPVDCTACAAMAGMECAYSLADGCSAVAQCVAIPPALGCGAITLLTGCDCEGTTRMWHGGCQPNFPTGMGPAPIAHMGSCP